MSERDPWFEGDAFYFGTYRQPGHYWWNADGRKHRAKVNLRIDGVYNPSEREGDAKLVHLKAWTILAFANRTDDSRAGSNAAFCFRGNLTFDEAVEKARQTFPWVVEHFAFDITEHTVAAAR